jgi:hypothetical protein
MDETKKIELVIVLPKNAHRCRYIINDGEIHSLKYDKLKKFLLTEFNQFKKEINEYFSEYRNFYINVTKNVCNKIDFDFISERKKLYEQMKSEEFHELYAKNERKEMTISDMIEKIYKI